MGETLTQAKLAVREYELIWCREYTVPNCPGLVNLVLVNDLGCGSSYSVAISWILLLLFGYLMFSLVW